MSTNYHYVTCPKCGHDRNASTAKNCEICNQKLGKKSTSNLLPVGAGLLILGLLGGGGYILTKGGDIPFLSGDSSDSTETTSRDNSERSGLLLLGDTFSGYSTFRDTSFQEALKESGTQISYSDEFDQAARANSLGEGKADLIVTTLDQFLRQKPKGKIVGLIDRTIGADAAVLNSKKYPQLKSLLDLKKLVDSSKAKGEKLSLVYAGDTPSEYLALLLDTKFDAFNIADFDVVEVADASEAWIALQDESKNVAVAILWEPFVAQAQKKGNTVLLSSRDTPKSIVDVLVASDRLLDSQPEKVSSLLEVYYRRIDANKRSNSELQSQVAADGNLSPDDAATVLDGIDFFTATESKKWMEDGTLKQRINAISAVLVLSGQLDTVPSQPKNLFTEKLLANAAKNTQTLIDLVKQDNPELASKLEGTTVAQKTNQVQVSTSQVQAAPNIGNLTVRGEVNFSVGSAQLLDNGSNTLDKLAAEISEFNPETVAIRVIGHTSKTGSAQVNQALSQQRADVVVKYFQSKGLKQKIIAEGKGFSEPFPNISPGDAKNQRTEIRLVRIN